MAKVDAIVKKETVYIALGTLILGALTQAVFLIIQKWNYTVLLGNILSWGLGVLNFFLMGLTVQNALQKEDKEAKKLMKTSQIYRQMLMMLVVVVGIVIPKVFSIWTVIIPLVFPRIVITLRPFIGKDKNLEQTACESSEEIEGE